MKLKLIRIQIRMREVIRKFNWHRKPFACGVIDTACQIDSESLTRMQNKISKNHIRNGFAMQKQ
jgi:hypothetical protein